MISIHATPTLTGPPSSPVILIIPLIACRASHNRAPATLDRSVQNRLLSTGLLLEIGPINLSSCLGGSFRLQHLIVKSNPVLLVFFL